MPKQAKVNNEFCDAAKRVMDPNNRYIKYADAKSVCRQFLREHPHGDAKPDEADYVLRVIELQNYVDTESAHSQADSILCELLRALGYDRVAIEFESLKKWYG